MISHLGIMFTAGLGRWLSRSDLVRWISRRLSETNRGRFGAVKRPAAFGR